MSNKVAKVPNKKLNVFIHQYPDGSISYLSNMDSGEIVTEAELKAAQENKRIDVFLYVIEARIKKIQTFTEAKQQHEKNKVVYADLLKSWM